MAKLGFNPAIEYIRGKIGNIVYRRMPDGSTCASTRQDFSRRTFSQDQKDHQSRFQQASHYARAAQTHPVYARLAARMRLTPYNVAVSDWFHPPVIHEVEWEEGRVLVRAGDNVLVAKVVVMVLDEAGEIREKGEGVRGKAGWWEYLPASEGRLRVEAWDLAGNVVSWKQ